MKILVVGLGSIGKRHIKNLKKINRHLKIAVLREHSQNPKLGEISSLVEEVFVTRKQALKWSPQAVFITNPAPFHIGTAEFFAKKNCHLFIEKPLSVKTAGVDRLLRECRRRRLVLMVGYVLRFLKPLRLMKKAIEEGKIGRVLSVRASAGRYLPEWRPGTDYRFNVSAMKKLGGGVIFELSHELDYVRWLAGEIKEVSAYACQVSGLPIDVEDIAEINLRFKNNALGNVHLDMVDRAAHRFCRVAGTKGTLIWDLNEPQSLRLFSEKKKQWVNLCRANSFHYDDMYRDELKHFLDCIRKKQNPLVDGNDGKRTVEIILAVKRSAKTGMVVRV